MSLRLFANNAITTLAAPITSTALSLSVTSGGGALFPSPAGGTSFAATLIKNGSPTIFEVILCTLRTTDNFTSILRAQEGTTALSWNAGDTVALFPTANDLKQFAQFDDLQKQLGNFAIDVGSANAYAITLTPALTAHVEGMPIRFIAQHTNTGNCTFNDGAGAAILIVTAAVNVPPGAIVAGGFYTATWDGAQFQLSYSPNLALYATLATLSAYVTQSSLASQLAAYLTIAAAASTYAPKANPALTGNVGVPTRAVTDNSDNAASTKYVQQVVNQQITKSGIATGAASAPGATISFPTPFPNSCTSVVATAFAQVATVAVLSFNQNSFQLINGVNGLCTWTAEGT